MDLDKYKKVEFTLEDYNNVVVLKQTRMTRLQFLALIGDLNAAGFLPVPKRSDSKDKQR